jgi:hypothetical protein
VRTSAKSGTSSSKQGVLARREAAIIGSTAFFAGLIFTVPDRLFPPFIIILLKSFSVSFQNKNKTKNGF